MTAKRKILFILCLALFASSYGQSTEFTFKYLGAAPTCNPFKDEVNLMEVKSRWKVSHGTPEVHDLYNNNFFNLGNLKAERTNLGVEKSEGLFFSYNFDCTHSYTLVIAMRQGEGDNIGFQAYAANGIVESSNTTCSLGTRPAPTQNKIIFSTSSLYDGPFGDFAALTIPNWKPDRSYSQIWISSVASLNNTSGSAYLDYIEIFDNGPSDSPTCGIVGGGGAPNGWPAMSGLDYRIDTKIHTNNDDAVQYRFLWNELDQQLDYDHRGYNVWVNGSWVWDNYDSDGDIFRPEISENGKAQLQRVGDLCSIYNLKVQGYLSSGAPFSKYTASSPSSISLALINDEVILNTPVKSLITISTEYKTVAATTIRLQPGFRYKASDSSTFKLKTINCADYNGLANAQQANEIINNETPSTDISIKIYSRNNTEDDQFWSIPNPVTDELIINGLTQNIEHDIKLVSYTGIPLWSKERHVDRSLTVDIKNLPPGLYIVQIRCNSKNESFKIIKR